MSPFKWLAGVEGLGIVVEGSALEKHFLAEANGNCTCAHHQWSKDHDGIGVVESVSQLKGWVKRGYIVSARHWHSIDWE
jgi:hypothetical protein